MNKKPEQGAVATPAKLASVPTEPAAEEAPKKAVRKAPAKKTAGRRAGASDLRSTN